MHRYRKGGSIFRQGEQASNLFIVRAGGVKFSYLAASGKTMTLGFAGPGTVLGLPEVMAEECYSVGCETFADSTLEHVTRRMLLSFLHENPGVAVDLLKTICHETNRFLTDVRVMAGGIAVDERLLQALHGLAETYGEPAGDDGVRLSLPLTVQELADRINCSRQWTSRALKLMETQGLIRRRAGTVTLTRTALEYGH